MSVFCADVPVTQAQSQFSKLLIKLMHINNRDEREKYAKHRCKAEKYPEKYMSIIIDGMDQEKTNIPHILSKPKALAGSYTLDTHITGVKIHGRRSKMYIDYQQFPHDANLTAELLSKALLDCKVSKITTR